MEVHGDHYFFRPHGQAVKTSPFHGGNTSSNLVGVIWTQHFICADVAQLAEQLICNQALPAIDVVNLTELSHIGRYNDPDGNRTRVTAVKGRCLNRLTTGPFVAPAFAVTVCYNIISAV